jgi:hypothetical protein
MKKQQTDGSTILKGYTMMQKDLKNWKEKRRLEREEEIT